MWQGLMFTVGAWRFGVGKTHVLNSHCVIIVVGSYCLSYSFIVEQRYKTIFKFNTIILLCTCP